MQVKSGEGSASIGLGYAKSKDETHQGSETNAVSSLSAGHDVKINAGRDANIQAAKVEADHDVTIAAERDVNLLAAQDKTNYEHMHEDLFAGVTATVSTGVVGAAKSIGEALVSPFVPVQIAPGVALVSESELLTKPAPVMPSCTSRKKRVHSNPTLFPPERAAQWPRVLIEIFSLRFCRRFLLTALAEI